jgi:transcriptional regulator with XRE-family HTH domain
MTNQQAIQLRQQLGLSAYAIAKLLKCSRTHYALYERGERQLSPSKRQALAAILKPSQP